MKTIQLEHTNDLWTLRNQPDWLEIKRIGISNPSQEATNFLVQNSFNLVERSICSRLQLGKPLELSAVLQLETRGYIFKSLLELNDTAANHEKLYWLVRSAVLDDPAFEGEFETLEQFNESIWQIYWNNANGAFIALHESDWVAMSGVHLDQIRNNSAATTLTGTVREHRALGLAQAVKTLAINKAVSDSLAEIRTANDSRNKLMLAINKKFGFVQVSEFMWFVK